MFCRIPALFFISLSLFSIPIPAAWVNISAGLTSATDICNITTVPGQDKVIAGPSKQGLYATTDGGATWTKLPGSSVINNMPSQILFDPNGPSTFWECGIYGSAVCRTDNGGDNFTLLGNVSHNDGMSVDFTDPLRKTILVGSHEQKRNLQKSTDGGLTWTNVGTNLPDSSHFSSYPLIIDSQTYLIGCSGWGAGAAGIWRTTDGGATWTRASTYAAFGPPLVFADGRIYYTVIWDNGVVQSTDNGQTWTQKIGYGWVRQNTLSTLPDGRLIASAFKTNGLIVSADSGKTWTNIGDRTTAKINAVTYNAVRKAFFVSCPTSGTYRLDFDYTVAAAIPEAKNQIINRQNIFRMMNDNHFTVPAGFDGRIVQASFYSVDGKLIARYLVNEGETINLKNTGGKTVSLVELKSIGR